MFVLPKNYCKKSLTILKKYFESTATILFGKAKQQQQEQQQQQHQEITAGTAEKHHSL